jgi:hypothetical protein
LVQRKKEKEILKETFVYKRSLDDVKALENQRMWEIEYRKLIFNKRQEVKNTKSTEYTFESLAQKVKADEKEKGNVFKRFRPGTKALHEIRHYQKTYKFLINRQAFQR